MSLCLNPRCQVSPGRWFEPARRDQKFCCRRCGQQARRWIVREARNTSLTSMGVAAGRLIADDGHDPDRIGHSDGVRWAVAA